MKSVNLWLKRSPKPIQIQSKILKNLDMHAIWTINGVIGGSICSCTDGLTQVMEYILFIGKLTEAIVSEVLL